MLVLLYLPTLDELVGGGDREWRGFFADAARRRGIVMIDGFDTFDNLPARVVRGLFIGSDEANVPDAAGHLSASGNQVVASALYDAIRHRLPPTTLDDGSASR